MPDICDLVLDDHETFRHRFAELDEHRDANPEALMELWKPLAELLELHAAVEEELFYPTLLDTGTSAREETEDAINDHNAIRDAVTLAEGTAPGSQEWWEALTQAREQNSDHMAEEERGALADLRAHGDSEQREQLGARWVTFCQQHAGLRDLEVKDRNFDQYLDEQS